MSALRNWLLLLLLGFIWGSSFILMKKGLIVFSDTQVAAMRMALAWLVTLPIIIVRWKEVKPKEWLYLLATGLAGNGIPAFLFTAAQRTMDSAPVGMMNSFVPLLTLTIGVSFFGVRTWLRQIIGLLIGLCGALILILVSNGISGFNPEAMLVVLASTLYAVNINLVKRFLPKMPSALIASGSFLWIGPFCLVYLLTTDLQPCFNHPQVSTAVGSIFLLAIVGTSFAVLLFNSLIQNGGPLFASMVTYIVPIFAIMWGVVDGEIVSVWQLLGVLIVLAGVYLVNKPINDN